MAENLKTNNELDTIGGDIYLFELSKNTPSIANIIAYAEIVRERSILRQMIGAASEIASFSGTGQGAESNENLAKGLAKWCAYRTSGNNRIGNGESCKSIST